MSIPVVIGADGHGNPTYDFIAIGPKGPTAWVNVWRFAQASDYNAAAGTLDAGLMINRAIAFGAATFGSGFTIYLPGSLPYIVATPIVNTAQGVTFQGDGRNATVLQPASGITGAVISITSANYCSVRGLSIIGASQTYSQNPACDGIDVTTSYVATLSDIYIAFMNGWGVQVQTSASADGFSPVLHDVFTTRCAGGIHIKGFTGHTSIGATLTNCAGDQAQVNEAIFLEDAVDVQLVNCGGYSKGAGVASVHVKGGGFITCSGGDFGATNPGVGPTLLIEASALGSPTGVLVLNNVLEKGSVGVSISAGVDHVISGNLIYFNQTHGISITGGAGIVVSGNTFDGNGQAGGAGNYDYFQNTGSGNPVLVTGNVFRTGQGAGVGQVSQAVHPNGAVTHLVGNYFTGATGANVFSSAPGSARNNPGYNPVGSLGASTPAVPATATPLTNTTGVDATVIISTLGGLTAVAIGGTAVTAAPAAGSSYRIPAGQTITLTWATTAPTWQWYGD